MELDAIEVFVKVVQAGSFSRAARELRMPNTTVSSKVARLEKRVGTTLIQRTTRKLRVTPAGQSYFERCVRGLDEIRAGEDELESTAKEATGLLRITAASDMAHTLLPPIIQRYLKKYPKVAVDLVVTSRIVDLVAEGVDLAIRPGPLKDSSLIARPLFTGKLGLWATQSYLNRHPPVKEPRNLGLHQLLIFKPLASQDLFLSSGSKKARLNYEGRIFADEMETLAALATLGEGIALLPEFLARGEKGQRLVKVLPEWQWGEGRLFLVYPGKRFVPPKLRAFIDLALEFKF
jgi:DNA-binding transcriptional LysR family regulator